MAGWYSPRLWCFRRRRLHYEDEIHSLTLRFKDPGKEAGFVKSHKERLCLCIIMMIVTAFIAFLVHAAFTQKFWNPSQYATEAARSLGFWQAVLQCAVGFSYSFGLFTARALAQRGCIGTPQLEVTIVCSCTCLMAGMVVGHKYYLARAFGFDDPEALWGVELGNTDANLIVFFQCCVTALHLLVPIRWTVLIPMEVLAVVIYALPAVALGSPGGSGVSSNVIGMVVLSILSSVGKRASERQERVMFAGLLLEKKLRFQAEFQLSEQNSSRSRGGNALADDRSSQASRPETTTTGQAFHVDNAGGLAEIRAIGQREQWLIDNKEVQLLPDRVLGEGGFGIVMAASYQNVTVAVKAPKNGSNARVDKTLVELCNELRILRRLRHPNIVFLYGACVDAQFDRLCLVLEFVNGAQLGPFVRDIWERDASRNWNHRATLVRLVFDVVNAMRYLHSRKPAVVHGDLKDGNVIVEELRAQGSEWGHRAKLLDFGLSRIVTRSAKPLGGTVRWMAPELFSRQSPPPDKAADVYSLGQLLYFITFGKLPFSSKRADEVLKYLRRGSPLGLKWPEDCSELPRSCQAVIQQCTQAKPGLRPTAQQVSEELSVVLEEYIGSPTDQSAEQPRAATDGSGHTPDVANPEQQRQQDAAAPQEFKGLVEVQQPGDRGSGVGLGTAGGDLPPVHEMEVLWSAREGRRSRSRSTRSSSARSQQVLAWPAYERTPMQTQRLSLAFELMRWNYYKPTGTCCWVHASVDALDKVAKELRRSRCSPSAAEAVTGQCPQCKLLLVDGQRRCDFCDEEVSITKKQSDGGTSGAGSMAAIPI